jgi:RimJ/RimL family protein N-acetyltransferase
MMIQEKKMYQLSPLQYHLVRPLFSEMDIHLPLAAILAGDVSAPIYVDSLEAPRYALTWTGHRVYLTGAPEGEDAATGVRRVFWDEYRTQSLTEGREVYMLFPSPAWEAAAAALLADLYPIRVARQYYEHPETSYGVHPDQPDGFDLFQVNAGLLAGGRFKNPEYLTEEMLSERASVEEFCQRSFGVCLACGDEIVGWCLSEYNTGARCEVGIATREDFRRRGFATLMTGAFIELACSRGVNRVGWHCYTNNTPSAATALKAGFTKIADYQAYLGWFDPAISLANNGYESLRHNRFAEAQAFFEKGMALAELPDWACWGAACAAARLGQEERAFYYLHQAVDRGFRDLERLQNSPHLESLHASPAWQTIVDRLAVGTR